MGTITGGIVAMVLFILIAAGGMLTVSSMIDRWFIRDLFAGCTLSMIGGE